MIFTIIISLILFALAGLLWGMREYYHKNPKVFDVLWKVKPISFFGSQSWKLKYKDYDNGDTRPAFPLAKVFPVNDFWHSASYVFKLLLIVGSMLSMGVNLPFGLPKSIWLYTVLVFIVQGVAGGISFNLIDKLYKRHKNET